MLDLKVIGESADMARVAARLDAIAGAMQVRVVDTVRPGSAIVRADVAHDSVDDVLDELERLAVPVIASSRAATRAMSADSPLTFRSSMARRRLSERAHHGTAAGSRSGTASSPQSILASSLRSSTCGPRDFVK